MSQATTATPHAHAHGAEGGHDHHAIYTDAPPGFVPHKIAHHYDSPYQAAASGKFAFWLFLATEIMLFGGMFAGYFIFHGLYPEAFVIGGFQLNWKLGALNTSLLLFSSFTMALGVRASQLSLKRQMLGFMAVTVVCGLGFLIVKYFEYSAKIEHGLLPGRLFHPHDPVLAAVPHLPTFFSIYWTMTAIHGLHVVIGMALILWAMNGASKNRFHSGYYMPVDLVGIYWHLVDLIWIFLFPLLYLVP